MNALLINFETLANISTTIGTIISTLTLVSAFQLYKLSKRDNYIKEIRNVLISYQYNSNSLNNLITYDISHELSYHVIYSNQLDRILTKLHSECFQSGKTKKELKEYLKTLPPITVSIHTELLKQYNELLKLNSEQSSKIYTDFPSLYRVYEAINFIFNQTIQITKSIVRDEDIYADIVVSIFKNKDKIKNPDDLKESIYHDFMRILQRKLSESDQDDINDALSILTLTTNSLMRLSDKALFSHMKKEKRIVYKELDETDNIFSDLLEAEKGLKLILKEDEILLFREFSTKIKVRNPSN